VFRDDIKHSVCQLEIGTKKLPTLSVISICWGESVCPDGIRLQQLKSEPSFVSISHVPSSLVLMPRESLLLSHSSSNKHFTHPCYLWRSPCLITKTRELSPIIFGDKLEYWDTYSLMVFTACWNFKVIHPHCVLSSITGTILTVKAYLFIYCTIQLNVSAVEYRYASLNDGDTFWEMRR
jgi:hypothetical protein